MSSLELTFLGSGDAFSSGGRLQSGILLNSDEGGLLLDCGSTLLASLERCGRTTEQVDAVAVSHLHGDHFGGLPYLLLDALFIRKRTRPLHLLGSAELKQRLEDLCQALYPGTLDTLPFELVYHRLEPEMQFAGEFFRLRTYPARHGQQEAFSLRAEIAGRNIAYTGDTEWTEFLPFLADTCDLLICECCTFDQSLPGHLDYQTLRDHASELTARRIILTHTGPTLARHSDRISYEIASDGLRILL